MPDQVLKPHPDDAQAVIDSLLDQRTKLEQQVAQLQRDAWDLVCAGDILVKWLYDHVPLTDVMLATQKLWRNSDTRRRNRCWKVDRKTLSPLLKIEYDCHQQDDEG